MVAGKRYAELVLAEHETDPQTWQAPLAAQLSETGAEADADLVAAAQALMSLVAEIGPVIDRFPVLITQHMPPTFTTILAEHLARASHRPAHEAVEGEVVKPGRI